MSDEANDKAAAVPGESLPGCKHEVTAPHTCPYAEEINDDDGLCTCCDSCVYQCSQDI